MILTNAFRFFQGVLVNLFEKMKNFGDKGGPSTGLGPAQEPRITWHFDSFDRLRNRKSGGRMLTYLGE